MSRVEHGTPRTSRVMTVDAPAEFAELCWNAGLTVYVRDDASGQPVFSIVDQRGGQLLCFLAA